MRFSANDAATKMLNEVCPAEQRARNGSVRACKRFDAQVSTSPFLERFECYFVDYSMMSVILQQVRESAPRCWLFCDALDM